MGSLRTVPKRRGENGMSYDFAKVEKKWQDKWYSEGTFLPKMIKQKRNGMV